MSFKRGITPPAQPAAATVTATPSRVGRQLERPAAPPPQIITSSRDASFRPRLKEPTNVVRGVLVDTSGKMLKGLSQSTIAAQKAHAEDCTQQCTRCGEMRAPADMEKLVSNSARGSNEVWACKTLCKPETYRNPYSSDERWQPKIPGIRFDREDGRPYDARQAGVTMSDLINRDAYHSEREVPSEFVQNAPSRHGQWSGGGNVGRRARGAR